MLYTLKEAEALLLRKHEKLPDNRIASYPKSEGYKEVLMKSCALLQKKGGIKAPSC